MASKRRRTRKKEGLVATLRDPKKITIAYLIAGLALVFGGSLGFGGSQCSGPQDVKNPFEAEKTSGVLATVEGREISWLEYTLELRDYQANVARQQNAPKLQSPEYQATERYQVLRQMIDMEYFEIRAKENNITVTDEEIEKKIDEYKKMLIPATTLEKDRSLLQRGLDALGTVKKEQAFENRLRELNPNLTMAKFRSKVKQELIAQAYLTKLQNEQMEKMLKDLTEKADGLRTQITEGSDFGMIAVNNSAHESSGNMGIISNLKRNDTKLPKQVIDLAFSLPVSELSQPIPVNQGENAGVWLMTVDSRKEAAGEDWEANKESIRTKLLEDKKRAAESGDIEMPEDENLTVTEDEVKAEYEEASIKVIFLKADNPMTKVREFQAEDLKTLKIVINDPELRATHHIVLSEWREAGLSLYEALKKNQERPAMENGVDVQYAIDAEEGRLRYLIANLWASQAFSYESQWFQKVYEEYMKNPEAYSGNFPETPAEIKEAQEGLFVASLLNLNRAIEIEDMQPFSHKQRAYIDIARQQLSPRLIEDLDKAFEYSSNDYNLVNELYRLVNQVVSMDDQKVTELDGERPTEWKPPVLPEDEMGLTLEKLDEMFVSGSGSPAATDKPIDTLNPTDLGVNVTGTGAETEPAVENEKKSEIEPTVGIPQVPKAKPSGPLTKSDREKLEEVQAKIQAKFNELQAEKQAEEERQKQMQEQQIQNLQPNE